MRDGLQVKNNGILLSIIVKFWNFLVVNFNVFATLVTIITFHFSS
ncbi:hypothetical protein AT05_10255 [Schleiferia thermophila str. Yellowstone]|nr:hypothetical protein AT05_10255 [Schleiferia thermophila str. Yellowstone]